MAQPRHKTGDYSKINTKKSQEEVDYMQFGKLQYGDLSKYEIYRKIGRGRYSEVFHGVDMTNGKNVVLKALKPLTKRKVLREKFILEKLKDEPNVVDLIEVVKDNLSHTITLVSEYTENVDYKTLYNKFTDHDVRHYMYLCLKALDQCHSNGIMHRDIKPHNIMYDFEKKQLNVIDFGLAEFYFPEKAYSTKVSSLYFKSPELLLGQAQYDYSIDIWALGATFASIIYKRSPFFHGSSPVDQIDKITMILGTAKLLEYIENSKIELDEKKFEGVFQNHAQKDWTNFVNSDNSTLANREALDLLSKMLVYNPADRITAKKALEHPYIKSIQEYVST